MTASQAASPPTAREWAEAMWLMERIGSAGGGLPDRDPAGDVVRALTTNRSVTPHPAPADPRAGDGKHAGDGRNAADSGNAGDSRNGGDSRDSTGGGNSGGGASAPAPPASLTGPPAPPLASAPAYGMPPLFDVRPAPGTSAPVPALTTPLFDADTRPGVLRDPLRFARTLRPFNRRVRSPHRRTLDEEATAVRSAELGRWSPVEVSVPDRWFEVALVVEHSVSMAVWQGVAAELAELLRRQGAFGDVRMWRLDTHNGKTAALRPERGGPPRAPSELFHPQGRRLILVLSDCVGDAWASGNVPRMLHGWARRAPVAVLQPLPSRLWDLCEAVPRDVRVRAAAPGVPNALLLQRRNRRWVRHGPHPVPMLELESAWFAGWARLVTGEAGTHHDIAALLVDEHGLTPDCLPPLAPEQRTGPLSPEQTVRRFLEHASPQARRLAARLAMVPLRPEAVRAVQRLLGHEGGPLPFAEILLGGLLSVRPGSDGPLYEFLDGVRERLLRGLGRRETLRTLQEVSDAAGAVLGARAGLLGTLVVSPTALDGSALSAADRELLAAAAPALAALGPAYGGALASARERTSLDAPPPGEDSEGRPGASTEDAAPTPDRRPLEPAPPTEDVSMDSASSRTTPPATGDRPPAPPGRAARTAPGRPTRLPRAMPLPQAGHFTGREAQLDEMRGILNAGDQVAVLPYALYGMGGVGKTRLAVEYVRRHHTEYQRIWWVDAEQPAVIREQLAALAPDFGPAAEGPGDPVDRVLAAMSTGDPFTRWLLVMDNAGAPDDVLPYLPSLLGVRGGAGHVLVTSRHSGWAERVHALRVDVFSREESVSFLRHRTPWATGEEAQRLAESLGDLPLALEHSAAAQTQSGIRTDTYLDLLETRRREVLAEPAFSGAQTVAATWRTSVELLRAQNPQALELLRLLACFGTEPIAQSFLHDARLLPLPEALASVARDELARGRAIRAINQFSLLTVNPATATLQVHRLLSGVLQDEMSDEERTTTRHLVHRIIAAHDPGDSQRPENWRNYADILPHIEPSGLLHCGDHEARDTALGILSYVIARGDFVGAIQLARRVVEVWTAELGPDDLQTLWARRQQASAHWQLSQFSESHRINEDVLGRLRATVGDDHEYTLTVAGATAADLRAAGRFTDALALDRDAYDRSVRLFGATDPYALTVAHNYGVSLRVNGHYDDALAIDEQCHEGRLAVLGPTARSTLFSVNNVARDLRECGRYAEALELQTSTLERYREQYGDHHPATLRAIKNMAVTCRKAGEFEQGLALARESFERHCTHFGPEHIETIAAATNLSNDLRLTGDPRSACEHSADALHRYHAVLGPQHPLSCAAAVNHGAALRALGRHAEARRVDQQTVTALAAGLPDDHPWLLLARVNLATDLSLAGEAEAALALGEECAHALEARYGDRHPATLAALTNVALDRCATGDTETGEELLASVQRRYLATLGPEHPESRWAAAGVRIECDVEPPPI
ncbi:FxSxx-COOH system tetratricopeptide repeat protein [Streptomyces sp. NK08204]|uniref:FxSxx-COOH system tetratricopeptide repeat protein n=1 Tax=Streptomyces sp. NK08204 TaxID=2873260 RepID=UPI001CED0E7A|nr:FxSxx-COOH system tetratricopeptide repeat protein [Streptomyces sp. NK08204]